MKEMKERETKQKPEREMESEKASPCPGWETLEFTYMLRGWKENKEGKASDEGKREQKRKSQPETEKKNDIRVKSQRKQESEVKSKGEGLAWDRMRSTDIWYRDKVSKEKHETDKSVRELWRERGC